MKTVTRTGLQTEVCKHVNSDEQMNKKICQRLVGRSVFNDTFSTNRLYWPQSAHKGSIRECVRENLLHEPELCSSEMQTSYIEMLTGYTVP